MEEKKYIKYIDTSKEVEISDVLPMEGVDTHNKFADMVHEAIVTAMKEDIKVNSVVLNEKFAKVNPHLFNIFGMKGAFPAMICGLECSMITNELPDEYVFAILEAKTTEREKLIAKTKSDTAKEIIKWIKLNGILEYGGYVIHDSTIEQMCKKYGVEVE
jgi:hypothetical protein